MNREIQVTVRDFGPIEDGTVDLRPLTVFVGASNSGKTYMSILVYALHHVLNGFPRLPVTSYAMDRYMEFDWDGRPKQEYHDVRRKLNTEGRAFRYLDLPPILRKALLHDSAGLAGDVDLELSRCLDSDTVSDLIRTPRTSDTIEVILNVSEAARCLWRLNMSLSASQSRAAIEMGDFDLIPDDRVSHGSDAAERLRRILLSRRIQIPDFLNLLGNPSFTGHGHGLGSVYYLPAARSGIMQSHRVIASSSLEFHTNRARLKQLTELPTLSGVMVDFMQKLILYEDREPRPKFKLLNEIADLLERRTLTGSIRTAKSPGGYPVFAYRPTGSNEDIRLARASSMVSELAPVVLFLRGVLGIGDTLIIEEPEAHLHPAAQTQVAKTLARLVRAGVRVLITTHSDWLLKQIGILIREGELEEQTGKPPSESALPSSLHPNEVGVWLFRQDGTGQGSTIEEVPFDRSEGVEPEEYYDVAEELYNRSADLQNRLEVSSDP